MFRPRRFEPEVQVMARTYNNWDAFKRNSPSPMRDSVTKVDYENFKQRSLNEKRLYDSNIGSTISHEHKVLASKNREQSLRALALQHNIQQQIVHIESSKAATINYEQDLQNSRPKGVPNQFNHRSPKKFVSEIHSTDWPFRIDTAYNVRQGTSKDPRLRLQRQDDHLPQELGQVITVRRNKGFSFYLLGKNTK